MLLSDIILELHVLTQPARSYVLMYKYIELITPTPLYKYIVPITPTPLYKYIVPITPTPTHKCIKLPYRYDITCKIIYYDGITVNTVIAHKYTLYYYGSQ